MTTHSASIHAEQKSFAAHEDFCGIPTIPTDIFRLVVSFLAPCCEANCTTLTVPVFCAKSCDNNATEATRCVACSYTKGVFTLLCGCGDRLCRCRTDVSFCTGCRQRSLCKLCATLGTCDHCGMTSFCLECIAECEQCAERVCSIPFHRCVDCENRCCQTEVDKCGRCSRNLCVQCKTSSTSMRCCTCNKPMCKFCGDFQGYKCLICGNPSCADCLKTCYRDGCSKEMCTQCAVKCDCNKYFCEISCERQIDAICFYGTCDKCKEDTSIACNKCGELLTCTWCWCGQCDKNCCEMKKCTWCGEGVCGKCGSECKKCDRVRVCKKISCASRINEHVCEPGKSGGDTCH